eukprot:362454-Chlamydomonas_euryale.AAC.2
MKRIFHGVLLACWLGDPQMVGSGTMAWQEHIYGRHAVLVRQFLIFHVNDGRYHTHTRRRARDGATAGADRRVGAACGARQGPCPCAPTNGLEHMVAWDT